jgi:DNA (cytosine-5)-methyltransferase 1
VIWKGSLNVEQREKLSIVDLFSGCGGMSLGFQNAGYEIKAAFDFWKPAVEVYKENFHHPIHFCDLGELDNYKYIRELKADIIIGGPPCQDFSSAGKRTEENGKGDLTIAFANIIQDAKPRFFVMENVGRIMKTNIFVQMNKIFKESGYGLSHQILDASLCGVPQKRKRFFLVGELGGEDDSLIPYLLDNLSERPMTVRDYFGEPLGLEHYYRHPRNYNRRAVFSIDEPSATIRGVNRPIPKGYVGHAGDSSPVQSGEVRPLTTLERSYIQTFPTSFVFQGAKTNLEQMIGNAVPVKLAEHVANSLKRYIESS